MAADFSAPAPVEREKQGDYLHDRERIPDEPKDRMQLVRPYIGMGIGLLLAFLFTGLAFEARDSWNAHRDWVVPATVPFLALAGIAMGHLIWRGEWSAFFPGFLLLLGVIGIEFSNWWRSTLTDGDDVARDVLSIAAGVVLGITVAYLIAAVIWVELKRPTRAPQPEM